MFVMSQPAEMVNVKTVRVEHDITTCKGKQCTL